MILTPDSATQYLFDSYPRYTGPYQRKINSFSELRAQMTAQSGFLPSFVSVFSFDRNTNQPIIDKLFIDIDIGTKTQALSIGQKLFKTITQQYEIPCIVLWSGNRGPHLFPLFVPEIVDFPTTVMKKVSYQFCYSSSQFVIDRISKKNIPLLDGKIIEPRRLCRYPNSLRPDTSTYSFFIDPDKFLRMTYREIKEMVEYPHFESFSVPEPELKISDILTPNINLDDWANSTTTSSSSFSDNLDRMSGKIDNTQVQYIIKKIIRRPCVRKAIFEHPNPTHSVRTSIVAELFTTGVSLDFAKFFISLLDWFDYDEEMTAYHMDKIYDKKLTAFGYRKMTENGLCDYDKDSPHCKRCRRF